jgi:hypothetical protein
MNDTIIDVNCVMDGDYQSIPETISMKHAIELMIRMEEQIKEN